MSQSKARKKTSPNYNAMRTQIADRLEYTVNEAEDLEGFNEHVAFSYLVADLFEGPNDDNFRYTDGANDNGIDFYVANDSSFSIYQCKMPELDTIGNQKAPISFGKEPIRELVSGIQMLQDKDKEYKLNPALARLRTHYQRDIDVDPENTSLIATVAVFGELTESAQQLLEAEKNRLKNEYDVTLRLLDWKDIASHIHKWDEPHEIDINIEITYEKDEILKRKDYLYVLAHAFDFYKAFDQNEWNLFDWNVRLQIKGSSINRKIMNALKHQKTQKSFHHNNNGLLITCRQYTVREADNLIRVKGAQIINGCQTVSAIRDAYDQLTPREQQLFREHTLVQTKILKTTDPEFIGELVISTNNQNPMNSRNLRSNLGEQKTIQRSFANLNPKWFYQRKDGEFDSLLHSRKVRW